MYNYPYLQNEQNRNPLLYRSPYGGQNRNGTWGPCLEKEYNSSQWITEVLYKRGGGFMNEYQGGSSGAGPLRGGANPGAFGYGIGAWCSWR